MKLIFLLLCCLPLALTAQDKQLIAEGVSPSLYLTHTVQPKENYYSIGRLYNISPKEIAPFNRLELEKGLSVGQVIRIPLTETNFLQTGKAAADESTVAVLHIVKDKEGLYRIAQNHNKMPLATLKSLNNLKTDAVSNGTKLVVGYLKVKTDQSSLAARGVAPKVITPATETVKVEPAAPRPTEKVTTPEAPAPGKVITKIEPVPAEEKSQAVAGQPINFKGGAFKKQYDKQDDDDATKAEGMAGVFKSTSGWTDGKYYCLHNSAAPNTIIKITSAVSGKSVYAKVLDAMPDLKQNVGLLIRISNAAADELGMTETNFSCTIEYLQ
jgi:LysM repeat protein